MKGFPQGRCHGALAIPAHLQHGRLEAGKSQCGGEAVGMAAGVDHEVGIAAGLRGLRERASQARREAGAPRIGIDQLDPRAGQPGGQRSHQAAHHAGPHHGDPVAQARCRVPQAVDRGFHVGRKHRPGIGYVIGHFEHRGQWHDVAVLMRVQTEHAPPQPVVRARLDPPDRGVPVLQGPRKFALLERASHGRGLAGRHLPTEHQTLGAAADRAAQRPNPDLVGPGFGQACRADLAASGLDDPEGAGLRHGSRTRS